MLIHYPKNWGQILLFFSLITVLFAACKKDPEIEPLPEIHEDPNLDESIAAVIPHIYINTEGNQEVVSKDDYINAMVEIKGLDAFPDLEPVLTEIKGRGNSTWGKPKNPYKLKLDKKAPVLGLPEAKEWVLLANYQDYTLMANAVAMEIAQQLNLPFTNTIIPVDLTMNGEYLGNYNLTQQIELKENRVDIGDDGVLLELDTHFDEEYQFTSDAFTLPVMVKDPDVESDAHMQSIIQDFSDLEGKLMAEDFPNNGYGELIDKRQLVRFIIVNNLTGNYEVTHPKSMYMHKANGGKYIMGPVWDFDWAYGIDENTRKYFNYFEIPLLRPNDSRFGAVFLNHFLKDPEVRILYQSEWRAYRSGKFEQLMQFIETYAARIRESQQKDFEKWGVGDNNLGKSKADMKTYLRKRAREIDLYVDHL